MGGFVLAMERLPRKYSSRKPEAFSCLRERLPAHRATAKDSARYRTMGISVEAAAVMDVPPGRDGFLLRKTFPVPAGFRQSQAACP